MNAALTALFALQQTDSALMAAQRQYQALDQGLAEKSAAETARVLSERLQRTWHDTARDLHDAELELKTVEAKKKDYEDRLWGGKIKGSPKELEAAQQEIEALGRQRGHLDDRILTLMDQVEVRQTEAREAEAALKKADEAFAAKQADYKQKARELAAKIQAYTAKRNEQAKEIPAPLLKRYEAVRAQHGGVGIARIENGLCGACHTNIPFNLAARARETDSIVTCDSCGRLLCAGEAE